MRNVKWHQAGDYHCVACDYKTNCYKSNFVTLRIHRKNHRRTRARDDPANPSTLPVISLADSLHCAKQQKVTYKIAPDNDEGAKITCRVMERMDTYVMYL